MLMMDKVSQHCDLTSLNWHTSNAMNTIVLLVVFC